MSFMQIYNEEIYDMLGNKKRSKNFQENINDPISDQFSDMINDKRS